MRRSAISIIAAVAAASCQQGPLDAVVIEDRTGLDAVSFSVDTTAYGDSIRIAASIAGDPSEQTRMSFICVDGKEKVFEHTLRAVTADTLVLGPYPLAAGRHTVSFFVSMGRQSRKEEIGFLVAPLSTDFLEEGGAYLYDGTYSSGYRKLDIPEGDRIAIPLGGMRKVVLLTGLGSSDKDSHGLGSGLFEARIESQLPIADYKGLSIENLKYYFHSQSTDKGECHALIFTLYPLFEGDGEIVIGFWDRERRIPIRVTGPKDIVKL